MIEDMKFSNKGPRRAKFIPQEEGSDKVALVKNETELG
jgi:hypothetical protein